MSRAIVSRIRSLMPPFRRQASTVITEKGKIERWDICQPP
jgi:hypothetical protein